PLSAGRGRITPGTGAAEKAVPQWSPAFIGRERVDRLYPRKDPNEAAMEPCLYRQGEEIPRFVRQLALAAAMEPCLYRQGEHVQRFRVTRSGECRNGALPLSAGRGSISSGAPT